MKYVVVTLSIVSMFILFGITVEGSYASQHQNIQEDIVCKELPSPEECEDAGDNTIKNLTATATNILTFLIGGISVIMTLVAGLMYVVSGGNPDKTKKAKNILLYAIVGIVIAIAAQGIVRFVLSVV